jgi:Tfp pilus assembly major pilin PilA
MKLNVCKAETALTLWARKFNLSEIKPSMLIRLSLIVAIIAALGAGVVNFVFVKDKITTLTTDRDTQRTDKQKAQSDLAKTQKDLAKTQDTLKQTQQDLADANTARQKAEDAATAQTKRADDLSTKLAQTTQQRDDAQNQLAAYSNTGLTPDQVTKLNKSLKDAQDALDVSAQEKIVLQRAIARLQTRLNKYEGTNQDVVLRADLRGKILVVDPKWDFVVLNIGDDQGVLPNGELLVSRDGKLVAKVVVRSIEKDRSIANIVPGWKLGDVFEGDEVTPAHPAS